jgi:uncharacterized protein (TIGR02996 family)
MTTEEDFQRALDADPSDWQTRLVFADWLQERNDPRAEGYRALGALRKWPLLDLRTREYAWTNSGNSVPVNCVIDSGVTDKEYLTGTVHGLDRMWIKEMGHRAAWTPDAPRRVADDEAALAFSRLSAVQREYILSRGSATGT